MNTLVTSQKIYFDGTVVKRQRSEARYIIADIGWREEGGPRMRRFGGEVTSL